MLIDSSVEFNKHVIVIYVAIVSQLVLFLSRKLLCVNPVTNYKTIYQYLRLEYGSLIH